MFDIGWSELLLIAIVALVVVGPKDLPGMFRTLGRFTAKAKSMAREFSRAMEDAAKEAGVKDMADDLKAATTKKSLGLDALEDAARKFEKWDPLKPQAKPAATASAPSAQGGTKAPADKAGTSAGTTAGTTAGTGAKAADAGAATAQPATRTAAKPRPAAKAKPAAKKATVAGPKAAPKPAAAPKKAPAKKGTA